MSCITAVVNKVNRNIVVRIDLRSAPISILCNKVNSNIVARIDLRSAPISILCNKKSFAPNIQCSFVCSSGEYLQVSPETIQWISEFIPVEYLVKSNTNWVVYT